MLPQVLIVDDDRAWLRLLDKELAGYAGSFRIRTAENAQNALALLRREHIMLMITDLRMPGMDGFDLLSRILEDYPDVPVIIVTAYDRPKTKDVVFKSGAVGYLTKPFATETLAREINKMLAKKAEGGNLHGVSLESFLQLVEMEQQTCTLHVIHPDGKRGGVLFFREGELYNARICDRKGKPAAYEIISWSGVSVFIENGCIFEKKGIEGDLQAILLDAMRSKDENMQSDEPETTAAQAAGGGVRSPSPVQPNVTEPKEPENNRARPDEAPDADLTSLPAIRRRLAASLGNYRGVEDVYADEAWTPLLAEGAHIGSAFGLGRLNVVYASRLDKQQYLVLPGEETTVIAITPDAPRDKIVGAVS
jgi:CheY-like chemotaxis protein